MSEKEPGKISAGDSLQWSRALSEYPADEGWTLRYALFNAAAAYNFAAAADGARHAVLVPGDVTRAWTPGRYDWTAFVTHTDGGRRQLFTGVMVIAPDPLGDNPAPHDGRSHARKVLDAIEALIEKRATSGELDLLRGTFANFEAERSPEKLMEWREKYRREVMEEDALQRLGRGDRLPRNIKARFGRGG